MIAPLVLFYSGRTQYWNFYDIVNKKVLDFQVNVPKKGLVGSSKGWLVFVKRNVVDKTFGVTLVNPFFRVRGCKKKKKIAHSPPSTKSSRLGKDTTWTYVDENVDDSLEGCCMIEDVANVGNKFYAVNYWSELLSFDVTTRSNSNTRLVGRGSCPDYDDTKRYIFEGEENKLLMVQRYLEFGETKRVTKKFRVFEMNFQTGEWTEKNTLGDIALFVGNNSSIYVSASKNSGFQSNCIYFNHDRDYVGHDNRAYDFGVYNVEDQSFPETYTKRAKKLLKMSYPLPIWVMPTLSFPQ
ncbi:hypothetical protein M0R45_004707 [Rubus argutus]|uniref:KIB1-4 beta-propeller domain-containing protein n=1 Tax=Rubus argutus TaxID=59490 RepID=A0AAW1YKL9_RUBAR